MVTAATEIFNIEIKIDKNKKEIQKNIPIKKTNEILQKALKDFQKSLENINDLQTLELANKFVDAYKKHLEIVENRIETVEDLAGLGMAVEKSSHDSLRLLSLMTQNVKSFKNKVYKQTYKEQELMDLLSDLEENLTVVYEDMQMIQPLFKIQRQKTKDISIKESITKVLRYFRNDLEGKISTNLNELSEDIIIKTNAGLILQVLINLIDNAIYWLNQSGTYDKKMSFKIDTIERTLMISDNGNGIREDIIPLVFNEFFSMKSNGRGLGLYIVRELLSRIDAKITVVENTTEKLLPGANFIIKFGNEEN